MNTAEKYTIDITEFLPHGNVLSTVSLYFAGAIAGTLQAAAKPSLSIYKTNMISGVTSQIGSTTTDVWGSQPAYETPHPIICGSLAETIDKSQNHYFADFQSESGANATAGCFISPSSRCSSGSPNTRCAFGQHRTRSPNG